MQMLRKWQHLYLGTEPRTEHCDITDTVVKKMTTSAFGEQKPTLLNMANAGKRLAKYEDIASDLMNDYY